MKKVTKLLAVVIAIGFASGCKKACIECQKTAAGWPILYKVCKNGEVKDCLTSGSAFCDPVEHNWGSTQQEIVETLESQGFTCK